MIRKSLLCAIRLVPWADGIVRRHEDVTPGARAAALAGLRANGGTLEPIVAGVRDAANEIERLLRKGEGSAPTFEATTADGVIHARPGLGRVATGRWRNCGEVGAGVVVPRRRSRVEWSVARVSLIARSQLRLCCRWRVRSRRRLSKLGSRA